MNIVGVDFGQVEFTTITCIEIPPRRLAKWRRAERNAWRFRNSKRRVAKKWKNCSARMNPIKSDRIEQPAYVKWTTQLRPSAHPIASVLRSSYWRAS
jgi:hypothetical protein